MTEPIKLEESIKLKPFEVDPCQWRRDVIRQTFPRAILIQVLLVSIVAVIQYLVSFDQTSVLFLWFFLNSILVYWRFRSYNDYTFSPKNRDFWKPRELDFNNEALQGKWTSGTFYRSHSRILSKLNSTEGTTAYSFLVTVGYPFLNPLFNPKKTSERFVSASLITS